MAKFSIEFKLEVVLHHERQGGGAQRTAAFFGLDHGTVRMWVAAYRQHGNAGLIRRKRRPHYDVAFKRKVLRFLDQGRSIREACAHFNISARTTILTWQRRHASGGIDALLPRPQGRRPMKKPPKPGQKPPGDMTPEEMAEELAYLRAENAYLKKLKALAQAKRSAGEKKR